MYTGAEAVLHEVAERRQGRHMDGGTVRRTSFAEGCMDTLCAALGFRDEASGGHVRRMAGLTALLLRTLAAERPEYGLGEAELTTIAAAAALHDIGKLRTPDAILHKPGPLSEEEMDIMRQHPADGCTILDALPGLRASPCYRYGWDICRWHHERWDGGGYPDGLRGDDIPIWAQAAGLADAFDALCSRRSYHEARPPAEALEMLLAGRCGSFNPVLLQCLRALCEESVRPDGAVMMSHPVLAFSR